MNIKTLTFHRQLFFFLLLALGFSYLFFLLFFTPKVYSGFLMQIIFFIDTLIIHPQEISPLIFSPGFIVQVIFGLIWTYLLFKVIKSIFQTLNTINKTHKFVQSINIIRTTKPFFVIKSLIPQVFTVGFINPRIFLSQKLLDISTPSELSSVLLHEQSHVLNRDPLKNLLVDYTKSSLPSFPFKTWLFGQYLTLIEISCDQFSQTHFSHPTSLISALLKIQKFNQPDLVSGFSAQSERIKILVGQKTQPYRSLVFANVVVIAFLFVISGSLYRTDVFYQCEHLLKCFENLITPDHVITSFSAENPHCLNQ